MRIVVIGGTGHVGTYLAPRLVRAGHEVINVSRGRRQPYHRTAEWDAVQMVTADRKAEGEAGTFARRIAELKADVVIDKVCYRPESARRMVAALRGSVRHYLVTGTVWVHGEAEVVPTPESAPRRPIGDYGINKNAIEQDLLDEARRTGLPATIIHPGHISGPGWPCVNPQGNFSLAVWQTIADGGELLLPNQGLECVHHVHADDVAQCFERAIDHWSASVGEAFHSVSSGALTLLGFARAAYAWFGREPKIAFAPLDDFIRQVPDEDAEQTHEHIRRSPCVSIEKARRLLGYEPRYTSLETCREVVRWFVEHGEIRSDRFLA